MNWWSRWSGMLAVVLLVSIPTSGCSSAPDESLTQADLVGYWVGAPPVTPDSESYSWDFRDDGAYGNYDGCNWGGGAYSVKGGKVVFGDSGATTRLCSSGTNTLSEPPNFQIVEEGKTLRVQTESGEVLLNSAPNPRPIK
jgi:heat shock protein HslJ